jgi:hypothetical protein
MSDDTTKDLNDLLMAINTEVFGPQPLPPPYAQQYAIFDNSSFFASDVQMPFLETQFDTFSSAIPLLYSTAISQRIPSPPSVKDERPPFEFTGQVKNADASIVSCAICNKQFLLSDKFKGSVGNAMCGGCRAGRSQ